MRWRDASGANLSSGGRAGYTLIEITFVMGVMSIALFLAAAPFARADGESAPGRDPKQPVDEAYTAKMKKYTTAPYFTSPLVDYLPASKTVPTPEDPASETVRVVSVKGVELTVRPGRRRR